MKNWKRVSSRFINVIIECGGCGSYSLIFDPQTGVYTCTKCGWQC